MAQRSARRAHNPEVIGSNPFAAILSSYSKQIVMHFKPEVVSANLTKGIPCSSEDRAPFTTQEDSIFQIKFKVLVNFINLNNTYLQQKIRIKKSII